MMLFTVLGWAGYGLCWIAKWGFITLAGTFGWGALLLFLFTQSARPDPLGHRCQPVAYAYIQEQLVPFLVFCFVVLSAPLLTIGVAHLLPDKDEHLEPWQQAARRRMP